MPIFRIGEAARILGVSDDTLRRWADTGRLVTTTMASGRRGVDGVELARFATSLAAANDLRSYSSVSAHNQFLGLVTRVVRDKIMARVEIQAGPHRVVSIMSADAVDDLKLEPGVLTVASVTSTNVVLALAQLRR